MASLTLQHIAKNTYFIPAPTNIGVYVNNNRAICLSQ